MDDYKEITGNFNRFALYDDYKDLYNKCLPAIKAFEDKLIKFSSENILSQELIRGFDKHLSEKASRNALENFIIKVEKTYAKLNE
jgi:hypothetical protein